MAGPSVKGNQLERISELEAELAYYKNAYQSTISEESDQNTQIPGSSADLHALISSLEDIVFEIGYHPIL